MAMDGSLRLCFLFVKFSRFPGIASSSTMNWRLLEEVIEMTPGVRATGAALTDFPEEIFSDHFPGIPVTPGVLLIEMCAQLAGRLVGITASQRACSLRLPFLSMVIEAKLRRFVGPGERLRIETELEELEEASAVCRARVLRDEERVATMRLMFAFLPEDEAAKRDRTALEAFERSEFTRLGMIGFPPGEVTVGRG
jgi:3-hydroxyacyl-[acyl-carrier-protein] dehydratase